MIVDRGQTFVFHATSLSIILASLWILMSGHFEPFLLSMGAASVLLTVWVSARLGILDREAVPVHLLPRAILYWPWLIKEIVKANIDVAKIILNPALPISPQTFRTRASQKTELGQAIYANSITLTPGTISIDLNGEWITVHALTTAGAEGVETGDMDRRVTRMEGEA